MFYLGPQLPSEREAVGLFPRVSFRSCLRRQKSGKGKIQYLEKIKRISAYSVTDFGMGSLSKSINWLSSLNWFTYLEGKVIYFVHVQIGNICGQSLSRICHWVCPLLVVHLLNLPAKFDTDDGLEEVVDDFDEVGRVDDETGLQVLPISKSKCLNSTVTN